MGANSRLYLSLIDEAFHRGNEAAFAAHLSTGYRAHDPFVDDAKVHGRRGLTEMILRELREVRYEVCDVFEQGDRVAARFLVIARRRGGARVAVPGISINRVEGGRLAEAWIVCDYSDVADLAKPEDRPADPWAGTPCDLAPARPADAHSRVAAYAWLVDQSYHQRRPAALAEALHPEYVGFDPFRARGTGPEGLIAFTEKVVAMYRDLRYDILDAVEAGDRLAVRYRVEGTDANGRHVVVPGISINHFEGARIRRGWSLNHYGALS